MSTPFGHRLALSNMRWSCGDSLTQNDRYPSYFVLIASHLTVSPVTRLTCAASSAARVLVASLVTKRPHLSILGCAFCCERTLLRG